jgi:serine/threonine protein kinase
MAPEIREGKVYDGVKADIFSMGVILFIIVHGIFPFTEASQHDPFYKLIMKNTSESLNEYFDIVQASHFSDDFKDLISNLLGYN